ncbi:MAG: fatty acid desaturase [Bradymonadaceae bacterium]|nr:fatty acid desaturase [Lujinxingiaceae bacterium]
MVKGQPPLSHDIKGLSIALAILVGWSGLLALLLMVDIEAMAIWAIVGAALVQTFLYTGLFITAHDAMHRTLSPNARMINDGIGRLNVFLFALFSFSKLKQSHWDHHRHPAEAGDPDYHDGVHTGALRWYVHFMREYVSVVQIMGMALVFNLLLYGAGVAVANLLVFWVAPSLLSTVQLFYFGTYRPHRQPAGGYADKHRASSNDYPIWLSFLTCYHFGYHWEHHERPGLAWWQLPAFRRSQEKPLTQVE